MRYRGVFFDFDYTLGDATEGIVAGFLYALHTMGYPIPTRAAIRHTIGLVLKDGFTELTGVTDEAVREEFAQLYRRVCTPVQLATAVLFPGAEELLSALHSRGTQVAIISSKPGPLLRDLLRTRGVADYVDAVVGSDQVTRPKPDPEGLRSVLTQLDLPAQEVLYCGDTLIDAATAQAAGVDFAAVLNGTTPADAFASLPHVFVAEDLPQLGRWLEEGRL